MSRSYEEFCKGEWGSRMELVTDVKARAANEQFPKRLRIDKKSGCTLKIKCADSDCNMVWHCSCDSSKLWHVKKSLSNEEHHSNCCNSGSLQPKTLGVLLYNNDSKIAKGTARDVLQALKSEHKCSVGGIGKGAAPDITSILLTQV